jgi:hypothetical protein
VTRAVLAVLILLALATGLAAEDDGEAELKRVSPALQRRIGRAIDLGVGALRRMQHPKGPWRYTRVRPTPTSHHQGTTALALLALIHSGVSREDPAVKKGVDWILRAGRADTLDTHRQYVYATGLVIWLLRVVDAEEHRDHIAKLGGRLAAAAIQTGFVGYHVEPGAIPQSGNMSTHMYAVIGLWEAEKAGLRVPRKAWAAIERSMLRMQKRNGGWGYTRKGVSTFTCTAHGVSCLVIAQAALARSRTERQAVLRSDRVKLALERLGWFLDGGRQGRFLADGYTYLAMERAGIVTGTRMFGKHDWYEEGAIDLLERQEEDGTWLTGSAIETAFAVLFLLRATDPVLTPTGGEEKVAPTAGGLGDLDLEKARKLSDRDFRDLVDALLRELATGNAGALEKVEALDPRIRPFLVERLEHGDETVRRAAITGLRALTGTARGFDPAAPEEKRRAAVDRWRASLD